ncbi:helicase associated domain-containing protein [Streptomyces sp. ECR3.8]|uniref:helicase associated domain-containing protein n=1 Tax=Streptomyces sp. ECR3.8 TaxID=3461009 RepID=UPI0040413F9C
MIIHDRRLHHTKRAYWTALPEIKGLRAHDEEAIELLAIPQEPQKDVAQPSMNIGVAPEEGEEESRLLLRFAAPRDSAMVADWVSFNVIDTERQDWARGWARLKAYVERVGNARVPYGHREGATPLGQWVAEQRRAYAAGEMSGQRAQRLERLGMVWSVADERFQENLEAAKAYYDQHWTLCAPRTATMLDRPIGQWLSNLRRPGALDGHADWKIALEAVDEDWNPEWPADWQRHYAALRELVADEEGRADVLRGVTVHGMDIGKWLARQRKPEVWQALTDGQRERLEQLGITPHASKPQEPAKPSTAPLSAFERGVAALAQYKAREGSVTVRPQRPRRATRRRIGGQARSVPVEHQDQARQAHHRQTRRTRRAGAGMGPGRLNNGVSLWLSNGLE